ncbi:hypothetical protein KEM52_002051 [Ascosphaera acerosa]|nr:hypothetical protein KEM52_002051 [Ascosphaera acerosa]
MQMQMQMPPQLPPSQQQFNPWHIQHAFGLPATQAQRSVNLQPVNWPQPSYNPAAAAFASSAGPAGQPLSYDHHPFIEGNASASSSGSPYLPAAVGAQAQAQAQGLWEQRPCRECNAGRCRAV